MFSADDVTSYCCSFLYKPAAREEWPNVTISQHPLLLQKELEKAIWYCKIGNRCIVVGFLTAFLYFSCTHYIYLL